MWKALPARPLSHTRAEDPRPHPPTSFVRVSLCSPHAGEGGPGTKGYPQQRPCATLVNRCVKGPSAAHGVTDDDTGLPHAGVQDHFTCLATRRCGGQLHLPCHTPVWRTTLSALPHTGVEDKFFCHKFSFPATHRCGGPFFLPCHTPVISIAISIVISCVAWRTIIFALPNAV